MKITLSSLFLFVAVFVVAGFFFALPLGAAAEHELKDASGKTIIRYVVESPEGMAPAGTADPAKQVGLILCFHEHDRPTDDEILPVRESLKRLGLSDGYVLLAGHSQGQKYGAADHEPIEKLIAWAKKTYPINPRRVYMYGKGEGGKISGEFATKNPAIVTAGITYSWGWWNMPSELTEAIDPLKSAPEFYMVLGLRDLSYHLTTVRDTYARVNAKGYHVIYREFEDLGSRTYHPPSNDDALGWATRLRNKNIPPSADEMKLLKHFDGHPAAGSINSQGYFPTLALVGGAAAGGVVQKLLESDNAVVRAAAVETCVYAVFSEDTMTALGKKLTDPSVKVRRSAIRALALNANWRSAAAQQFLINLATNQDANPNDRVSAADAIVQAVRLQVRGVRQDPPMFKALVALLEDSNEELRVMAANTLAPIRDREFRGDLGRPERKTPNGGWAQWLDEISTKAAGYLKDYEVCGWGTAHTTTNMPGNRGTKEPVDLFCLGGDSLLGFNLATGQPVPKQPALAFKNTLEAAQQGYLPAEAALGMFYANGKGVEQDYAKAANWWVKAAEAGHVLAASNAAMVFRGGGGVKSNPTETARWEKFVAEHSPKSEQ